MSDYIKKVKKAYFTLAGISAAAAVIWTVVALHADKVL